MLKRTWLYAIALAAMPVLAGARLDASEIRDKAKMFSTGAARKATAELDRVESRSGVSTVIETVESLPNVSRDASSEARRAAVQELADRRAREIGYDGVYVVISKKDRVISDPLVKEEFAAMLPRSTRLAVREAFTSEFKNQRFDDGLLAAVGKLDQALPDRAARAKAPVHRVVPGGAAAHGVPARPARFGIGSLLFIALAIFGVLLLFRMIGRAFSGGPSMGGMGRPGMGGPGYGPGPGPGYGPGYGYGGGGGFFSNMLGGLGGALAGNWLYDQFSGRHSSDHVDASSYTNPGETTYVDDPGTGGDNYVGGDDDGGMGASWGEPDNSGGGTWGDSGDGGGGGGGWFGGGGDGGGSWGGGDGGGDWGGGGDAGGGW